MFESTEVFAEILLAGVMLLFAVSPIMIRFLDRDDVPGLLALKPSDQASKSWIVAILLLGLAYSFGIAGYRVVGDVFARLCWQPDAEAAANFKAWKPQGFKPEKLGALEFYLRDHSAGADEWVDRHKSYEKVLRTASFASVLLLFAMAFYRISRRPTQLKRYEALHFSVTILLAILFLYATWSEAKRFADSSLIFYKVVTAHAP
jgi:multisubunit Na+/H+ antiporter MnhF subunit